MILIRSLVITGVAGGVVGAGEGVEDLLGFREGGFDGGEVLGAEDKGLAETHVEEEGSFGAEACALCGWGGVGGGVSVYGGGGRQLRKTAA